MIDHTLFDWGVVDDGLRNLLINELFVERIYNRLYEIKEGDVVVDVGASVGPFIYSIKDKKPSQIYTFEPSKTEFPTLVKNTRGLPVCHINKAIWEGDGLTNQLDAYFSEGSIETMKFKTFRELYAIDRIDFLKTDCEGGEYFIFNEENIDFLVNNVNVIVGEWHLETPERKESFRRFRDIYLPRFQNTRVFAVGAMDPNDQPPEITWDLHNEHFLQYYKQVIVHIDNRR